MRKSNVTFRCGDAVVQIDTVQASTRQGLIQLASGKHIVADVCCSPPDVVGLPTHCTLKLRDSTAESVGAYRV